jgi:uncharacterized protein involved in exopolysaccharide biosynthesis/Mrp family chromosome partitioning ATPase
MKEPINVQARVVEVPPPGGLTPSDLYYVIFRHKWKIALIFLAAVAAVVVLFFIMPPPCQSEARILIRYVLESKSVSPETKDAQVMTPDSRGENIINSEIEILTSLDLANQVVDAVGADKILARLGGGTNRTAAASVIQKNVEVEVPRHSNILRIIFRHPDPAVVQPVLSQLLGTYLRRHVEIHQGVGVLDDFFLRQADQLRARLAQTEQDLKKLRTDAQVISLEDTKRAYIGQIAKIQDELLAAEAELAERRTALETMQKLLPVGSAQPAGETNVSPAAVEQYRTVCAELDTLLKRQAELRTRYTDEYAPLKSIREQVAQAESRKQQLEKDNPKLTTVAPPVTPAAKMDFDPVAELSRANALEAKIKVLTAQLDKVRADATRVVEAEPSITELQRRKELEEANYRYYASSLERTRVDESLGAGKITNISVVQTPSPPVRDIRKLRKPLALILAVGLFGGLGLAFVTERFLDQTIKRVADVERHVRMPLFLSIPDISWRGVFRLPGYFRDGHRTHKPKSGTTVGSDAGSVPQATRAEVAPWDPQNKLRTYYEGLRDRLITYFEVRNMTHRPKLVAVTSCTRGAGVTTLAAGLAATLSETGDGNVLLVDMNLEQGAAHQFYKGKPGCGLSEALEPGTRDTALVQENLYLVSAQETNNQKLPRVLPKRFAHLVPRMKASDYDFIIFDMPPVTQTSVTPRLAGFMDMVLMVIESEKTGQEIVKRANAVLNESHANVAAVLNKRREYLPQRLSQEL